MGDDAGVGHAHAERVLPFLHVTGVDANRGLEPKKLSGLVRGELFGGQVAGSIGAFVAPWSGKLEVTYWIGREFWGKGIDISALVKKANEVIHTFRQARDKLEDQVEKLEDALDALKCGLTIAA